jgi:hypothetical protein
MKYLSVFLLGSAFTLVGCKPSQLAIVKQEALISSQLDTLYYQYVNGDTDTARNSLLTGVGILEKSSCFDASSRASLLTLEYARLAVLESKSGNELEAAAFLLNSLKRLELNGVSTKVAMAQVNAFNMQEAIRLIEKMDKGLHVGELANYNKTRTEPAGKGSEHATVLQ